MACKSLNIEEMADCEPQTSLICAKSALEVLTELTYEFLLHDGQSKAATAPDYDEVRKGVLDWAEKTY